jgi:hypothetical protein
MTCCDKPLMYAFLSLSVVSLILYFGSLAACAGVRWLAGVIMEDEIQERGTDEDEI